jgi:hypothetical protein
VNFNGTSAANPFIAGSAALVMKQNDKLSAAAVRTHLLKNSGKLQDEDRPMLDIYRALHAQDKCK